MLEEQEIKPAANKSKYSEAGVDGFSCMARPAVPTNLDWCSCANCCIMPFTHENSFCHDMKELRSKMKNTDTGTYNLDSPSPIFCNRQIKMKKLNQNPLA